MARAAVGDTAAAAADPFRSAFEQAAIGMAAATLSGHLVRANRALCQMVGASSEAELVARDVTDLAEEASRPALRAVIEVVAAGQADVRRLEHALAGSGSWVVTEVSAVRDEERRPIELLVQVRDESEQRAADEALRRSEERFRLLVESVGDYAIFMLDPEGRIASWNAGAQRIKGYTADEVMGRYFALFYNEADRARNHPAHELAIAVREGRYEEEGQRVRKDGTTFVANVVITPIRGADGVLVGFAKVTRDITERRRMLDELERLAAERSQFLAVTAHELRTPIAVVNGFARLLRDRWAEVGDADRGEMLAALARGGDRLSRLVEELLTASRLEAGGLEIRTTTVDAGALVTQVVAELAGATGATIDVTVEGEGLLVHADPGRVEQMLGNYLTNALRYGKPPVSVVVEPLEDAVRIRVLDEGLGIPDDLASRLFGKFVRARVDEGTGLGLFVVRELARAQGGEAWYEERPGGGACFALRLPRAESPGATGG